MHNSKMLASVLALAAIALSLSACGNKTAGKQTSGNQTSQQSTHQSSALWNQSKAEQLDQFMKQWAPTMHQSYTRYNGNTDLKTASGSRFPSDFKKSTVNNSNDSIGWNPKGKGTYDYNVVALYNYNRSGAPVGGHITYAFAFHDGQPVALVDETTNGNANWTETKNTDVEGNFEQIAKGQKATFSASQHNSSNTNSQSNSKQMTFDQAAQLIQKGGFTDFNYEDAKQTHDGSHPTANGGYLMITYPGAKGQDHFTITKTGKNKYHIKAEYGSSDGGFTLFDDQSDYGPTSADVTN